MENDQLISRISLREYIIDFFGSLMPGLIGIFFLIIGFILPLFWTAAELEHVFISTSTLYDFFQIFSEFILMSNFVILIFLVIIYIIASFITGVIYNRRDIKLPDYNSFLRTIISFENVDDIDNWIVNVKGLKEQVKDLKKQSNWYNLPFLKLFGQLLDSKLKRLKKHITIDDVQFPYKDLPHYLKSRGYDSLASKVPWNNSEIKPNMSKRSKTFINILKNRIYIISTENYNFIIKHEGEIRMSATLWHLSKTILNLSMLSLTVCVLSIFSTLLLCKLSIILIIPILFSLFTSVLSFSTKRSIEGFLHYQRVREIFYVLTTAQAVSNSSYDLFNFE